jgi:hypothetical protein
MSFSQKVLRELFRRHVEGRYIWESVESSSRPHARYSVNLIEPTDNQITSSAELPPFRVWIPVGQPTLPTQFVERHCLRMPLCIDATSKVMRSNPLNRKHNRPSVPSSRRFSKRSQSQVFVLASQEELPCIHALHRRIGLSHRLRQRSQAGHVHTQVLPVPVPLYVKESSLSDYLENSAISRVTRV